MDVSLPGMDGFELARKIKQEQKEISRQKENLVSRNVILKEVWGKADHFTARSMDVHLTKLRKHLSIDPTVSIINIHGQGFILKENNPSEK